MINFQSLILALAIVAASALHIKNNPKFAPIKEKITKGHQATIQELPYQAFLLSLSSDRLNFCGGVIISNYHILTAAHCFCDRPLMQLMVRTGSDSLSHIKVETLAAKAVCHPDYRGVNTSDIGLVILSKPLEFDATTSSIPMMDENDSIEAGQSGTISGYGMDEQSQFPPQLKAANVTVLEQSKCDKPYAHLQIQGMFCTSSVEGDTCLGDSGGPFVINGTTGPKLAGVIVGGYKCNLEKYPGIYHSIPFYRRWIDETMRKNPGVEVV